MYFKAQHIYSPQTQAHHQTDSLHKLVSYLSPSIQQFMKTISTPETQDLTKTKFFRLKLWFRSSFLYKLWAMSKKKEKIGHGLKISAQICPAIRRLMIMFSKSTPKLKKKKPNIWGKTHQKRMLIPFDYFCQRNLFKLLQKVKCEPNLKKIGQNCKH